jgi:hypothetical protein
MTNDEPLHDDIIKAIIEGYEQGLDIADLYDQFDGRVDWHDIETVYTTYEESLGDDDFDHDDNYDMDSALGSIGWGTDEFYGAY